MAEMTPEQDARIERMHAAFLQLAGESAAAIVQLEFEGKSREAAAAMFDQTFLMLLAENTVSPAVFRVGPSIDPFEERLNCIRNSLDVAADVPAEIIRHQSGLPELAPDVVAKIKAAYGDPLFARMNETVDKVIAEAEQEPLPTP